jgi:hypothetical protein
LPSIGWKILGRDKPFFILDVIVKENIIGASKVQNHYGAI